jgi:adenine-specific DNA-methyltransferase
MAKNRKIQKAERESLNIKDKLLEALKASTPEIFAEGKINWDKVRLALGEHLDASSEKFNFTWAGKAGAVTNVLIPSKATLRPAEKESVKFDKSENLFIEGDNLEVLKLLQKSYFEQVKMIYIDPPYNTGNDFVYKDDFRQPLKNYLEQSGQVDSEGNRLSTNTQASGRFHSDWLTMMYPRLKLAWNLLRHDGVIFVSIDDNEVHHLRMLMDEIFGEENLVSQIEWQKRYTRSNNTDGFTTVLEHILCYRKPSFMPFLLDRTKEADSRYSNPDNDPRGPWKAMPFSSQATPAQRPNLCYKIVNPNTKKVLTPKRKAWRSSKKVYEKYVQDNLVWWGSDGKASAPSIKKFLSEAREGMTPINFWSHEFAGNTDTANREIKELFTENVFETAKPTLLIQRMLELSTSKSDIILDFFAGSGTTAHAVLSKNQKDDGNRKFIMIQMPEPANHQSEAYKAGYKSIADIAKERIRRVIKGYGDHKPIGDGFKVFKLGKSNYYDNLFEYDPDKSPEENDKDFKDYLNKAQKELFPAKINELDIVYENVVKEGLSLNAKIEEVKLGKSTAYKVSDTERELYISLNEKLSASAIEALTGKEYKEKIFICFDGALGDSDKANLALNVTLKTI